jgi:hypothetical protein
MTKTTDQASARLAGQIAWQRQAAALPGNLRDLAAKEKLPPVNWTVLNTGATLHGECVAYSSPQMSQWPICHMLLSSSTSLTARNAGALRRRK